MFNKAWCKTILLLGGCSIAVMAQAMDFAVHVPYLVMSGGVVGNEARILAAALKDNPGITTIILKDSHGGFAPTGYDVGQMIRERGLNTALSGYCLSSCSRMFLGGNQRQYSDDQPLEMTTVGFHGNYSDQGQLLPSSTAILKPWIDKYSDGKANPALVDQWVHIQTNHGMAFFYHKDAQVKFDSPEKVLLCLGTEDRHARAEQCQKPHLGNALDNGIVTTWDILKVRDVINAPTTGK
ncbi:hypothetical protein FHW67_001461 [Herbaspirillum sp. Sphag1AN]|uniref:hypothetical protein n=1 Tax=unclassified Herbaspirillum TaxID=2624150 RepID=UPI001618B9EB|nr:MULTISPECIES: hypothetical protein [unclassified Herbaspirillum]MBB3212193.1 hypothetical protein [Herbaspirillum sp. Sphag1AN]MBB3243973.1 hypothetical protein [Herbaspirillum sp. Sphag64]